jgi:hypothetical protein
MHWEELCRWLAPERSARELLAVQVTEAKKEMARICLCEGVEGKPAPLRFLSAFWNARPSFTENDIRAAFSHYLEQVEEKESRAVYQLLLNGVAANLDDDLYKILSPQGYRQFRDIGISKLLAAPGSPDPMGIELKQLLAGLPPVEKTAVTTIINSKVISARCLLILHK